MSTLLSTAAIALLGSLTYGPEQFRTLILEPVINSPDVQQLFTIRDGVKAKEDVLFVGRFDKVVHLDLGCGSAPGNPRVDVRKLTWDPERLEAWIAECGTDFDGTFMAWGLGVGYKRPDLQEAVIKIKAGGYDGTEGSERAVGYWNEFVQEMFIQAIRNDIFRIGFFGDKSITAARLTLGADDVKNYVQLDGAWKEILAMTQRRVYTIAANTTAGQELAAGESLSIFRALLNKAPQQLKADPDKIILCTESIATNWADYRESQNLDTSFVLQETGIVGPRYRNVAVVPVQDWDRILNADFVIGGMVDLPHRAVLTTKRNLQLGFDSYDAATQVEAWYNKETKLTHMRANFKMDVKVMSPDLVAAAY